MKLRIRRDSLRLRLTQGEVGRLVAESRAGETVHFSGAGADQLSYAVEACKHPSDISARLSDGQINVTFPVNRVTEWARTGLVRITGAQVLGDGKILQIMIEQDFRCLQPRTDEDESDNFPNPEQGPNFTTS